MDFFYSGLYKPVIKRTDFIDITDYALNSFFKEIPENF